MPRQQESPETVTLTSQRSVDRSYDDGHHTAEAAWCKDGQDLERGDSNMDVNKGKLDEKPAQQAQAPELETMPKEGTDLNVLKFDGPDDPRNPMNWTRHYKYLVTALLGGMTFVTTFTSAIFSTAIAATAKDFHVSTEVMTLGTSLFLLGFTLGPIVWGPISELYGRRTPLILGTGGMACFQVGVAVAQNVYTIMICRFFGGVFGCAPLCVVGGALSDFWDPVQRGVTVGIYSVCTFVGPVAAPIIGGYIAESYLGWRWTEYISVIMAVLFWSFSVVLLPETYHPRILQLRAAKIRRETGNWALHAEADEKELNMKIIIERYLTRPFRMLRQEPILSLLALYIGLSYGILYLFFTAFPISFQKQRHWSQGNAGLPFLSITIGVILGGLTNAYHSLTTFRAALVSKTQVPESRLPPMILGGFLLPPGLLWWAWTSSPHITPWPQIIAGIPMGMGILLILVNGLNYIVDVYKINANSAIAANTMVRSLFGAVFPLFAEYMYARLGVPWATSLLGFLAGVMAIGPIVFWKFGSDIRKKSRFVPEG